MAKALRLHNKILVEEREEAAAKGGDKNPINQRAWNAMESQHKRARQQVDSEEFRSPFKQSVERAPRPSLVSNRLDSSREISDTIALVCVAYYTRSSELLARNASVASCLNFASLVRRAAAAATERCAIGSLACSSRAEPSRCTRNASDFAAAAIRSLRAVLKLKSGSRQQQIC